ncbi:glycoside hydrolase family 3 C-terminal domain-containing protein [Collinsella intestinalis]|uniref:glycoside hydrolase family 3 C-terminal domain-containing protein n=1 Tax=Collinsella intestinalis TaxID=147207 RepID=UPI001F1B121E|nr:glycoside hydrolase family 3 C-terminal domain-containing protein [Collinsella intestinalis]
MTDRQSAGHSRARELTLEERVQLLAGESHWKTHAAPSADIPSLFLSDGPHGLRKQESAQDCMGIAESRPATCFPTASALACSFDPELVERVGAAIGEEARRQGVDVVLGPGVNIKRHPLCGRNFEYFSEDPVVSGELGAAMVRGIQSRGVGACLKHFAANSQEHARMVSDSVVDERTLRELYLAPFEHVVRRARPWSVMTAYNKLNGVYCSENEWLLREVLRGEWGFDGAVVSDWGAMSSSVASVRAGLDLCMPGPRGDHARALVEAVRSGDLEESRVGEAASQIERLARRVKACQAEGSIGGAPAPSLTDEEFYRAHADLAREAAVQSAVLLKNDGVLPLNPDAKVAVIGAFARMPRYQGSGSSRINPKIIDNIWYRLEQRGVAAEYADGCDPTTGDADERQLLEAETLAARSDVAVVVAGLPARYESEGFDRKLMVMPRGMRELIDRICAANPRTVVVLQGGAPMEMPWCDNPAAILLMYLSGCQGGGAAVDVLVGDVNPSGKLAETWPVDSAQTALGTTYPDMDNEVFYREGPFVGYRYYDAVDVEPAFPFGHGESYTEFAYEGLEVKAHEGASTEGPLEFDVSFTLRNIGPRIGAEVAQVYIAPTSEVVPPPCPVQWLAGFAKIELEPGGERQVVLHLDETAFRKWDASLHRWRVYPGEYEVRVASSSRDIRLTASIIVADGQSAFNLEQALHRLSIAEEQLMFEQAPMPSPQVPEMYRQPIPGCFSQLESAQAFAELYARPLPERPPVTPFTIDSTVSDMGTCWLGRRLYRIIDWVMAEPASKMNRDQKAMMQEMAADMPLRSLTTSGVPLESVKGFVSMLNGHYLTGFIYAVRNLFRK